MAEAAVNFVPSGDGTVSRTIGYNQQQGVLVLSAAFRLVAQADVGSQGVRSGTGEGGLYAQWFTNCFGPQVEGGATPRFGQAEVRPASPGCGQEKRAPDTHEAGSQLSGSEVRELISMILWVQEDFRNTVLGVVHFKTIARPSVCAFGLNSEAGKRYHAFAGNANQPCAHGD